MERYTMEKLIELLKSNLPTVEFADGDKLITGGKIDSIGVITIVMAISEEYEITLDPEDISVRNFDSIESIWKLINQKQVNS